MIFRKSESELNILVVIRVAVLDTPMIFEQGAVLL